MLPKLNLHLIFVVIIITSGHLSAQKTSNSYIFGHSLVNHDANRNTLNRANYPDWMYLLAEQAGHYYAIDGQFGFLPNQTLPPNYQWGFIDAPGVRTNENENNLGVWNYDNVTVTLANFIQQTSTPFDNAFCNMDYINGTLAEDCNEDPNALNSIEAVLRIYDYATIEEPGIDFYIYENFPEFNGTFPPSSAAQEVTEFTAYYNYCRGEFHDWWILLHDSVIAERPQSNIKMIPVGPILANLITGISDLSALPATTLYEDGAPHGHPVIYFLTALIHYSAIYEEKPPANFTFPDNSLNYPISIPNAVKDNYQIIVDQIWNELLTYNFGDGTSRVFKTSQNSLLSSHDPGNTNLTFTNTRLYPNPGNSTFYLDIPNTENLRADIEISNLSGQIVKRLTIKNSTSNQINIDRPGIYFIRITGKNSHQVIKLISE